jgi:dihydroflavonol-4-reductase
MILVTGASGLVGSHLVTQLVKEGRAVRAFTVLPFQLLKARRQVEWIKGDILDVVALEEAMEDVQQVYHCAAIVSFNPRKKAAMHKTNVEGTANVVNACLDAGYRNYYL